ncbi:MAG: MerR family transcriptional regulator [Verrucomicrobiota bacterium]
MEDNPDEFYEISAVARLTGISSHVLRVWERRYCVVEPKRSETRRRQYSQADLQKLSLLKTLVDGGHAISSVARLSTAQLEERVSDVLESKVSSDGLEEAAPAGVCRIALVGTIIRQPVRDAADRTPALRIIGEFATPEEMMSSLRSGAVDLLIIEKSSLFPEDIAAIQEAVRLLKARRSIVIYQYASERVIQPLDIQKITALRAPVEAAEIQLACIADVQLALRSGKVDPAEALRHADLAAASRPNLDEEIAIPVRAFSDEELVRIGRISSVVECECPQHLANLLSGLAAFERYSNECEDRNEDDAKLHRYLHQTTAKVRSEMESALREVLVQEGIEL